APFVTVLGTGQINVNTASPTVIRSLPGMGDEAIDLIVRSQKSDRPLRSIEELMQRLSSGARSAMTDANAELAQRVTFETREVIVNAEGWVDGSPLRVHGEVMYARGGDAMFTVWRRTER
ncbi:MAG: hypothetical protein ABJE10_00265, partial [bacterium]